jgi:excisionase family DNA binding protein
MDEQYPPLPGDSPSCGDSQPAVPEGARGDKQERPQPVQRPLTIGQLQRVLEMRLGFTVSINTLERWCRNCKIHAVRLGTEWRIPREVVEEIIKMALLGERF